MLILLTGLLYCTFFNFAEAYPDAYRNGRTLTQALHLQLDTAATARQLDVLQLEAIVFPETCRYNIVQDELETASVVSLYGAFGAEVADYSIGHYQMKPSFVEQLEAHIQELKLKEYQALATYTSTNPKTIRFERIERLADPKWQTEYLCAFYTIMETIYVEKQWESNTDKVRFYAAAYNFGFWKSAEAIIQWQEIPAFPQNTFESASQFPYASIAVNFYCTQTKNL